MKTLKRIGLFLLLKLKEVGILGICCIIIPYGLGKLTYNLFPAFVKYWGVPNTLNHIWFFGVVLIVTFFIVIGMLYLIYVTFFKDWLKSNWREVKRRIP